MIFRQVFIFLSILMVAAILLLAQLWPAVHWAWLVLAPLLLISCNDLLQRQHTILRIYPFIGHFRYMFESVRVEIQQYFVESDVDGAPI